MYTAKDHAEEWRHVATLANVNDRQINGRR